MFSTSHTMAMILFILICVYILVNRKKWSDHNWHKIEIGVALFLILFELTYHLWMYVNGVWIVGRSLPFELCNIELILSVILLLTRKKLAFELLFFIAILGTTQAIFTPALTYNFPHFRFFHCFIAHMIIVWVALYFTWVRRYQSTITSVIKLIVFINVILPFILFINKQTNGNYWFLRYKPEGPSLFDILGPYPWYIFSIEGLLMFLSLITWLIFRNREKKHAQKSLGI